MTIRAVWILVFLAGTWVGCSSQAPSDYPDELDEDSANVGVDQGERGDEDGEEVPGDEVPGDGEEPGGSGDDGGDAEGDEEDPGDGGEPGGEDGDDEDPGDGGEPGGEDGDDEDPGDGDAPEGEDGDDGDEPGGEEDPGPNDPCPYECIGEWRCENQGAVLDGYTCDHGVCCEIQDGDTEAPGHEDGSDGDTEFSCEFECVGKNRCEVNGGIIWEDMSCDHGVCCEIGTDRDDQSDPDTASGGHDPGTDAEPCPYECSGKQRCEMNGGQTLEDYACDHGVCCLVDDSE